MIDTHSHLYDEAFLGEEDAAIGRALLSGVSQMIVPDTDSKVRGGLFDLVRRHPGVLYATVGLHPEEVRAGWQSELEAVEQAALREAPGRGIVAIGEVGIDWHWSTEFAREQEEVFRAQLALAEMLDLPVIVHTRDATEATLRLVREFRGRVRGVFHAFSGSVETFREIQRLGDWYVGIGGVVTYKKASIAETIKEIPLERILLETDSPYLTPVPHRGERNESAYIPIIAAKIALQKGLDVEVVDAVTTTSARKLFGI